MSVFKRILGLSDPYYTAAFQKMCGITTHYDGDSKKSECNGVNANGNNGHVAGTSSQNGSAFLANGDSLAKTQGKNGYVTNHFKDNSQENHSSEDNLKHRKSTHTNGFIKNGTNGHSLPNGVSNHLTCDKELVETKERSNGVHSNGHGPVHKNTEDTNSRTYSICINNYFLYYIFSFGASLGNEVFYILFFSGALWNFDNFVTRKMLIMWGVIMYVGQAMKDIIRWPRPLSPPAIRLETRYCLEYGMPSTHAMVGVAIPFGMLMSMIDRYEFNLYFGVMFAVTWCILVSFSRLYLGMHSALDISAGVVFAGILMTALSFFVDQIDTFIISNVWGGPVLVASCVFACAMYPSLEKWSTARGDTTISVAVFSGCLFGLYLTGMLTDIVPEPEHLPFTLDFPTWATLWIVIQRQVLGVLVLVVVLSSMRIVMLRGVCRLWGLDYKDPKSKQTLRVELPYKFAAYFTTSVSATYLMPIVFNYLNIMRSSYYSEINNYQR